MNPNFKKVRIKVTEILPNLGEYKFTCLNGIHDSRTNDHKSIPELLFLINIITQ